MALSGKTGQWFAKELTTALQAKGWCGRQDTTDPVSDGEPVTVQLIMARALPANSWCYRCSVSLPFLHVTRHILRSAGLPVKTSGDHLRWSLQVILPKTGKMQPVA